MIKYDVYKHEIVVDLSDTIEKSDIKLLRELFVSYEKKFVVTFENIYAVPRELVLLFYTVVYERKRVLEIFTQRYRLHRYLEYLGFKNTFCSYVSTQIKKSSRIEIVLIGGSADSTQKILEIIRNVSFEHLAVIIVQHVGKDDANRFDTILQNYTTQIVKYAQDGEKIRPAHIYLAPSNRHLKVSDGRFYLSSEKKHNYSRPSISVSYQSFAQDYKEKLVVIHECGFASDGVDVLEEVHQCGSLIIIQNQAECGAKSMIQKALLLHEEDYIFSLQTILEYLKFLNLEFTDEEWISYLLKNILLKYKYNFLSYNREMIRRRISVFMIKHAIENLKDCVGSVLFNSTIFHSLFLEFSINVTEMFRDACNLKYILEILDKNYKEAKNIKIWSAGCSSGEEAYSLAIILQNQKLLKKSLIYATDFNDIVLQEAKNGIYSKQSYSLALENFSLLALDDNLENYIEEYGAFVVMRDVLRKKILFFHHNLNNSASFNEFDIIICKNVLIYFDEQSHQNSIKLFYDSLKSGGFLVLGEKETLLENYSQMFEQYGSVHNIFIKR